jgi:hypothetical protein
MIILSVIAEASVRFINASLNGPEKFLPSKMKQNGNSYLELKIIKLN